MPFLIRLLLVLLLPGGLGAGTLEDAFENPPSSARPYVWWHWMGANFSREGITKDLEAMKAEGIGGATIFNLTSGVEESAAPIGSLPWPEQTYRSPAYWAAVKHAATEADRLGLELGLHNTVGYSATGGPWISQEQGMMQVLWSETPLAGGAKASVVLPQPAQHLHGGWGALPNDKTTFYRDIAVLAFPAGPGPVPLDKIIDLSAHMDATGRLVWPDAPTGHWTVMRLGYGPTGAAPHPVPDELLGVAREANKMDAAISRYHWEQVINPLKEHLGAYVGGSFRHLLIDSYEAGDQTWTPGFRERFRKRLGYDLVPWLATRATQGGKHPDLRIVGDAGLTARFAYDLKAFIAEEFQTQGWDVGVKACHEAGLLFQQEPYSGPFDTVAAAAAADMPMGEFWSGSGGGIGGEIVSAARAAGHTIIGAEAFTGMPGNSRWTETPAGLLPATLGSFAAGVNRLVLHHWVQQPFDDRYQPGLGMGWWGTHFSRFQTWFEPGKAYFAYVGRSQVLLQHGETVVNTVSVGRGGEDTITESLFLTGVRVVDGRVVLPSGRNYALLSVPHTGALKPEIVRRIVELVKAGATIASPRPERSPSLSGYPQCDEEVRALATTCWPESGDTRALRKGRLFTSTAAATRALDLAPSFTLEGDGRLRGLHRNAPDADIFFVANLGDKEASAILTAANISDRAPEIWNAEDASIRPAPLWHVSGDSTAIGFPLAARQALFVVFRKTGAPGAATHAIAATVANNSAPFTLETGADGALTALAFAPVRGDVTLPDGRRVAVELNPPAAVPLAGAWTLSFGGPRPPAPVTLTELRSWTTLADPAAKYFSGTATYARTFTLPNAWNGRRIWLDLGDVRDLARVTLNGRDLGVSWHAPYRVELTPALRPGENRLAIAVTNTWHNRLVGDEQQPADVEWGAPRTLGKLPVGRPLARFPDWFLKNQPRPSAGRHAFVTWNYFTSDEPLLPAGLLGPVMLRVQAVQTLVNGPDHVLLRNDAFPDWAQRVKALHAFNLKAGPDSHPGQTSCTHYRAFSAADETGESQKNGALGLGGQSKARDLGCPKDLANLNPSQRPATLPPAGVELSRLWGKT